MKWTLRDYVTALRALYWRWRFDGYLRKGGLAYGVNIDRAQVDIAAGVLWRRGFPPEMAAIFVIDHADQMRVR